MPPEMVEEAEFRWDATLQEPIYGYSISENFYEIHPEIYIHEFVDLPDFEEEKAIQELEKRKEIWSKSSSLD